MLSFRHATIILNIPNKITSSKVVQTLFTRIHRLQCAGARTDRGRAMQTRLLDTVDLVLAAAQLSVDHPTHPSLLHGGAGTLTPGQNDLPTGPWSNLELDLALYDRHSNI